jgi:hypothetical protein
VQASVQDARAHSFLNSLNNQFVGSYDDSFAFGTHTLSQHGLATTTIGSDASGKPFIQFAAISSGNYAPSLNASLDYYWKITNSSNLQAPVLVHISTSGWIDSIHGFTGQVDFGNGYVPNSTNGYVSALFQTNGGVDQRSYGLKFGATNLPDITRIDAISNFTNKTSTAYDEFSNTFDIWVHPNIENHIQLRASANGSLQSYANSQFSDYFAITGYIDPVITIDSAYSNSYTLEVSNIPFAPVPVPGAVWLFGSGLLGFLGLKHSRRV